MTQQRLFDSHTIDTALTLESATQVDEHHVALAFSDGHYETYDLRVLANELKGHACILTIIFPVPASWSAGL